MIDTKLQLIPADNMTVRFQDERGKEIGKLAVVWRPRLFGHWGRETPRVAFTGDVERSAKKLFKFMIPMANRCCRDD